MAALEDSQLLVHGGKSKDRGYGTYAQKSPRPLVARDTSVASSSKVTLDCSVAYEDQSNSDQPWTPLLKEKRVEQAPLQSTKFLQTLRRWSPTLVLENAGSVARDHLASERTFLAYVRTSLAISMAGVGLAQMFLLSPRSNTSVTDDSKKRVARVHGAARPLAVTIIMSGILVLVIGAFRYFHIQTSLLRGVFFPARAAVVLISSLLVVTTSTAFFVLVTEK